MGLKTRIFVGFLLVVALFFGGALFAVERMQRVQDDLRLIHRGYLALARYANELKTLQEAKDEYVERALAEADPRVRRRLVGYAGTYYPHALRSRLAELLRTSEGLKRRDPDKRDRAYLDRIINQIKKSQSLHDDYDAATQALLTALDEEGADLSVLTAAYTERGQSLSQELGALSVRLEAKLGEAVLQVEGTGRDTAYTFIGIILFAALVAAGVALTIQRGLAPVSTLLESARKIRRGSLDVEVTAEGPEEIRALAAEFNQMAGALRDRERRVQLQTEDLARLKAFSEDVIRTVRVGIIVLDETNHVRTVNPAARSVFALSLLDVDGKDLAGLPQVDETLAGLLREADAVREAGKERFFPVQRIGGHIVDVALVPIKNRAGASGEDIMVLGDDVSAREEARERLLESERLAAIGRLAAQITHEIRNPLSSVGLNMELLEDDIPHLPVDRQDEARSILRAVGQEVDRLKQITEGYLRYARLPAQNKKAGDVGDLLADLLAFCQSEAHQAGVMLELHIGETLPAVPHDRTRLRQALLNLLRNAEEAAGRGGTVRLSAERADTGGVRVSVEDSGPGLSADAREQLFRPFFTTKKQGTGLGLSLTQEIVKEHGGSLDVGSSPLGGAAFAIVLPATEVAAPVSAEAERPA